MQRFSGLLSMVAVAGISALAGIYLIPAPSGGDDPAREAASSAAPPDHVAAPSTAPERRSKARAAAQIAAAAPKPQTWTAVVLSEPSSVATSLKSSKPGDAMARAELTRDLQRELTRVGCYGGEIHGYWTQATRRAMAAFMDRMNASLPIAEPDYIQLTLIKGQGGGVCGAECPTGEIATDNGRCVPYAIVAQASRKAQRAAERRRSLDVDEPHRIAELNHGAATAAQPSAGAAWAQDEVLPWQSQNRAFAEAVAERPADPPPGRMSVGAPLPPPTATVAPPPVGNSLAPAQDPALAARSGSGLDRLAALDAQTNTGTAAGPVVVGPDGNLIAFDRIGHRRASVAPKRKKYYAAGDGYSRKSRGLPRRGSMPYIVMQSLGGFHR